MALITLEQLKARLDITDNSKDVDLQFIIDSNSLAIESYCQTKLEETVITDELYEGSGNTNSIVLNNINVSSIQKVEWKSASDDDNYETIYDVTDGTDTYNLALQSVEGVVKFNAYITAITGFDALTEQRKNAVRYPSVRITYTCGFSTIPKDLQNICLQMCMSEYKQDYAGEQTVKSEAIQDLKVSYDNSISTSSMLGLKPKYQMMLDQKYKRWF